MKRRVFLSLGTGALMWLTGCAPIPRPLSEWNGKFSISFPEQGKIRHEQGQYEVSLYDTYEIWRLKTPLGSTIATLKLMPNGARLELYNGDVFEGPDPETLLSETLNMNIPVRALRAWFTQATPQPAGEWIPHVLDSGSGPRPWTRLKASLPSSRILLVLTQS